MPRFKLVIEYAGTRYSGWQIQKNARTVAGEIERAITETTRRREFELYGAGRTDAGVHAWGQVVSCAVGSDIDPLVVRRSLNAQLGQLTDKVDRWRTSEQKHRWVASALLAIEPRLQRIKRYRHLPQLQEALRRALQRDPVTDARIA